MANIHPTAYVEDGAQIADDAIIGPMCAVSAQAVIGAGTRLVSHVAVIGDTTLGENNVVWPNAVLGGDPQDLGYKGEATQLVIGDHNNIREHVTMHRGTPKGGSITQVGNHNYFMAVAHIAHDCKIGDHVIMANNVLLAGHIHIEDHVVMSGGIAIHHFATIGKYAFIGGLSRVLHDVPPYMTADGQPAHVRKINRIGLQRGGISEEQIERIEQAYRRLYRRGYTSPNGPLPMAQRLDRLEAEFPDDEYVNNLIGFIRRTATGPHGRYLEAFRTDRPG